MSQGYKSFPNQWMKNAKHIFLMLRNETILNLSPLMWYSFIYLYYFSIISKLQKVGEDMYISIHMFSLLLENMNI